MNILLVNSTRRWGGVKSWSLRCAQQLAARGHDVCVAGRKGDPFLAACGEAGLPILPCAFGASWSPLLILRFARYIRRTGVEVVVCNTGRDLSTAGAAARLCGVPVVHRVGSATDFRDTWIRRGVHRWLVARILVPAHGMRQELLARFAWILPEQVAVSWNAAEAPRGPVDSGQAARLVCLGRLAGGKGLETLLVAFQRLRQSGHAAQLDLVGEGPLEGWLRDRVCELGLEDSVRLPGFIRPASDALRLARIGILPSLHEGFPNTLIEYWAAGLAVVASDLPGVREAMGETPAALVVPPGDSAALEQAMLALLEDGERCAALAHHGLQRARTVFGVEEEARRLEEVFTQLARP